MLSFSIVIATTKGRSETLEKCLSSIFANEYPQNLFEVIVVDSGIDDRGLSVIESFKKRYPNLRFYSPGWGNVGPAKARNLGIKKAQNEMVAFTDDDCLVPKDWLKSFADGYRRHPKVAGVGGYLEAPEEILRANVFAQYEKYHEWSRYGIKGHEFVSKKRNEAPFETNSISYKKEILEKVGGFDEDYSSVGSGEDGDLKERVLGLGYSLLFIPVKVIHLQEYSLGRFLRQQISRGGGILVHKKKQGLRVESRPEILAKIILGPLVFFRYLVEDEFKVKLALIDTLGFIVRQLGKLKFYE
jgi:GT2 family glycosyltransferase